MAETKTVTSVKQNYQAIVEKWQKNPIADVADLDIALDNFRILFAYNSNAIENPETTYHQTREIFENGKVIGFTGNLRTLFEIQNQKVAYETLRADIVKKRELSPSLIKEVHKSLMYGCYDESRYSKGERYGEYKLHDYVTGDGVGSAPEDVEKEIENLCEEVNAAHDGDPLTVAVYLHLKFEEIHPFADGNGRVGRTLMNYYLLTHNYPPTIIFNEDKETYFLGLAAFDKTGNIDGFMQFVREQTIKTWQKRKGLEHPELAAYLKNN